MDKESEISKSKKSLHRAKEDEIKEYYDFTALLAELGSSFADGFDDYLRQVRASFPNPDLSHITIDAEGQTTACPVESKRTDDLFVDDTNLDPHGDGEVAQTDQEKTVEANVRQPEVVQTVEEQKEDTPVA